MSGHQPRMLDACCGSRMFYFDRQHPDVLFGDKRAETITVTDRSHGKQDGQRTLQIEPDIQLDFRQLPFADGSFHMVSFDPPHLVRAGPKSWLAAKYGKLGEDWREDLRRGFAECFRVLAPNGVLIFKWNETQVKLSEVLALTDVPPHLWPSNRPQRSDPLVRVYEAHAGGSMKERPILFSGAMILAILAGQKTQTRRVMKNPPTPSARFPWLGVKSLRGTHSFVYPNALPEILAECPYGQPGGRLWAREAWRLPSIFNAPSCCLFAHNLALHAADGRSNPACTHQNTMLMPRWASRILLEVVSVRVERLQSISEADAEAEGIDFLRHVQDADETLTARDLYECLWDSINGEGSWAANPWVWVVEFKRVEEQPR